MSKMELALTTDGTPGWFGYDNGAAHMIMSGVITLGGDHIGGNSETMPIVCANGKTLETARVSERFAGDKRCKRCESWAKSTGAEDAMVSATEAAAKQENGPSVADMIMSDPEAVVITLDGAATVAEMVAAPVKKRKVKVVPATLPAGPERDKAVAKIWADTATEEKAEKPVKAKKAAKGGKAEKPVGEVKCIPNAPGLENGDGSGVCRACSWHGPMKEHGESGEMVMTAHWVAGRAPKSEGLTEVKVGSDAPAAPATVDTAHKGADDMIGGKGAGMLPGRTSLTRGSDMTGATPRERKDGGKPVRTTNDTPLGRERTDTSAKIEIAGGQYGYLTPAEVGKLSRTESRRYWRHVGRNRDRATAARKLIKSRATDTRTRAERMSG